MTKLTQEEIAKRLYWAVVGQTKAGGEPNAPLEEQSFSIRRHYATILAAECIKIAEGLNATQIAAAVEAERAKTKSLLMKAVEGGRIADAVRAAVPEGMELQLDQVGFQENTRRIYINLRRKAPVAKPCPVCGRPGMLQDLESDQFFVSCGEIDCDTSGPSRPTKDAAVAAWNSLHFGPAPDLREAQAVAFVQGATAEANREQGARLFNPYDAAPAEEAVIQ